MGAMGESANNRVLIVGIGGLGAPAAAALVRGGVQSITLLDPDPVELSNLPRQLLYAIDDIGTPKVVAAARRLKEINPAVRIETRRLELVDANADEIIREYGFVIDATDNPAAKFLINDRCVGLRIPFVYGGVLGMTGQAMTVLPGRSACLRCLFEEPPEDEEIASCRDAGIIGPAAGAIGEAQAAEAMRWIRGETPALAGAMLCLDANNMLRIRTVKISARAGCACGAAGAASAAAG
jgi:molybdopterin/thiamine biosynthesis adenylyltransferase